MNKNMKLLRKFNSDEKPADILINKVEKEEPSMIVYLEKRAAIDLMLRHPGVKVAHTLFDATEYIYYDERKNAFRDEYDYIFEDIFSSCVTAHDGLRKRSKGNWETGWQLFENSLKLTRVTVPPRRIDEFEISLDLSIKDHGANRTYSISVKKDDLNWEFVNNPIPEECPELIEYLKKLFWNIQNDTNKLILKDFYFDDTGHILGEFLDDQTKFIVDELCNDAVQL